MTSTDDIAGQLSGVAGQKIASALLSRLPALADELLKRILGQSDVCGKQSEIYGDDRLVPIDDLHQSLQDNLTFMFSNLGCPVGLDYWIWPRRTSRLGSSRTRTALTCCSSLYEMQVTQTLILRVPVISMTRAGPAALVQAICLAAALAAAGGARPASSVITGLRQAMKPYSSESSRDSQPSRSLTGMRRAP